MDVGFAGLGHMGLPMATRLAGHGFPLTVWNRTASRAAPLAEPGVRVAGSPGELAAASDVIITMLADGAAARAVWCGPDGLLAGCRSGCIAVDMSTIGPNAAREIAVEAERHGADFLDAPVSGSTALMAKDLELALGIATGAGMLLPVTTAARRFLGQACAEGFADADFACVATLLRGEHGGEPDVPHVKQ
jgi:3-hydroxyisobutyrate dehydrogenase-like beta-hydroxyacid dehydrogenase